MATFELFRSTTIQADQTRVHAPVNAFHEWTAWIVELLEKDDEAFIVVVGQTWNLRQNSSSDIRRPTGLRR